MNRPLALAAIAEAVTGLALVLAPALVARLLFGAVSSDEALIVARVTGLALISLGVACGPAAESSQSALRGMTVYSFGAGLYLTYLGVAGQRVGPLLWPAAILHLLLALLLARTWWSIQKSGKNASGA
jgi:hypothetical protein